MEAFARQDRVPCLRLVDGPSRGASGLHHHVRIHGTDVVGGGFPARQQSRAGLTDSVHRHSYPRLLGAREREILVFDPPHEDTLIVIKRLVGMPGDTLEMRNKTLYLNGRVLDEPYVRHNDAEPDFSAAAMLWQQEVREIRWSRIGTRPR